MTQSSDQNNRSSVEGVALIVGGGPGISASCARLFSANGMRVAVAARTPDKLALEALEKKQQVKAIPPGTLNRILKELNCVQIMRRRAPALAPPNW
jgi:NAD(P)-dependent dehydrogenase (short-subunit alcohol dehydrogenase family)